MTMAMAIMAIVMAIAKIILSIYIRVPWGRGILQEVLGDSLPFLVSCSLVYFSFGNQS